MFLFSYKITYSEEKNLITIITKKVIEKKLLFSAFKKCGEYINEHLLNYF